MKLGVKARVEDAALVERRRRQVVAAAIALFGKRGYHASTIRDIAAAAGVSVGLIYQYFGDKEDVLFLAILDVLDSYRRRIPLVTAGIADPLERLRAAVHAYCSVIDANVDATVLAYRETKSLRRARRNVIKQKEADTNALLARYVEDCIAAGLFDKRLDVALFVYQIVMFAHAWALKAWHWRMSVDEYVARGLDLMLTPLLAASRPRRPASASPRTRDRRARSP
ncbi:MAG TPA: TetR/AcrR family transcriptional regulator [Burkholderiales bacterium]|nr:TetR/AcrR family transcriptional regulator [Burkholderiales bacterium]